MASGHVAEVAGRRERTKERNRTAILDAAREVFADLGFGAATVRDIVRGTDLATGTFYNYFPDKESVFRALLEDSVQRGRVQIREARLAAGDLESFVRDGFRAYFEFLAGDADTFELLKRNTGTIRMLYDVPATGQGTDELLADLEHAIETGLVPAHDVDYMAAAMVGIGFEVAERMLQRDPVDVEGATEFATRLFLGAFERA